MRFARWFLAVVAIASLAPAAVGGEAKSNPAWEKMKSLAGTWQGTIGGEPVSVTYTLVSNGTTLMESLATSHEKHDVQMITMYHPDGDTILATHYCAAGNQPRMRASTSGDPKKLDFQFVDATNVQGSSGEVMRRLVVTFQDADHFQQAWTSSANGKEETTDFVYTRKK